MWWIILGCSSPPIQMDSSQATDTHQTTSTSTSTSSTPPEDLDGDGFPNTTDCNDHNPNISPDASEEWDEVDQNCDGVIDGDGNYVGSIEVDATAVYEGTPYRYHLSCPGSGSRIAGQLVWSFSCTPDAGDPMAQLLLGATLTFSAEDTVQGDAWSGEVLVASTNGWDTHADGSESWKNFDEATVKIGLSAFSLNLSASGSLKR